MLKKPLIDIVSILGENEAIIDGHFELPCGRHIQSYVDTTLVMQYPSIAAKIAKGLAALFDKKIDAVFSPTPENSILAQEVARVKNCRSIFAVEDNGVMKIKGGMEIKPKENILIVDNVTMTCRKVEEAARLVKFYSAVPAGIAVIVDRSSNALKTGVPLRALLSYPLDTYSPDECPLCKSGTKLTKTGKRKND